ncbi:MAG: pyruvate dehydrogenase (acetyl-transferring) E1 component subunit alpha [Actinomycetota bacterium]|nr:pyruvate dehydrogenase (acetyl-transferring) E1 component subunit alpha [Actinomycetota bacterium]
MRTTDQMDSDAAAFQLIAPDGTPHGDVDVGLSPDELRDLLRLMILSRAVDRDCVALQRQGQLTVYPSFLGQEAAQVGSASALGAEDFVFPSFRELAAAIVRGVDPVEYLHYHRGTWHGGPYDPHEHRFAPICVPVATQILHAVGYAMGLKLDGRATCSLAYFGDGATSEGDFHEACNIAAVFHAPVVLFCQNNGWAISVPAEDQYAAPIWLRARGYGFPGVRVDGNDVLAVHQVTREAAERAREGGGPTLIEAMTYRMDSHSTADDATRYRTDEEVAAWRELDPIERYATFLSREGIADDGFRAACESEAAERVSDIRAGITATPAPPVEDLSRWTFAEDSDV